MEAGEASCYYRLDRYAAAAAESVEQSKNAQPRLTSC